MNLFSIYIESIKENWYMNIVVAVLSVAVFQVYNFRQYRQSELIRKNIPKTEELKDPLKEPVDSSADKHKDKSKVYEFKPIHSGDDFETLTYEEVMQLSKKDRPHVHMAKDFILNEVLSRDGTWIPEDNYYNSIRILDQAQAIRNFVNGRLQRELKIHIHYSKINSGDRSEKHNEAVGGVGESKHKNGAAIDFTMDGLTTRELYRIIDHLVEKGEILPVKTIYYEKHIHMALPDGYIIGIE